MGGGLELALGCHYRVAARRRADRAARGQDRPDPRRRRHAAAAARARRRGRTEPDRQRRAGGERAAGEAAGPEAVRQDRRRRPGRRGRSPSRARRPTCGRCRKVRDLKVVHRERRRLPPVRAQHGRRDGKNFPAPLKCVDAVAASLQHEVRRRPEVRARALPRPAADAGGKALRHVFWPSARPPRSPTCPADTPVRAIKKAAVIGAGTMGGGIAMNFLNAGIPVMMLEMKQEALDKGTGIMRKNYEAQVKKGKLKQDKLDERAGPADHDPELRRPEGRRPRDRGGVRGHGRQGAGVQDARRGDEARRDPRHATPRRSTSTRSPRSRSGRRT